MPQLEPLGALLVALLTFAELLRCLHHQIGGGSCGGQLRLLFSTGQNSRVFPVLGHHAIDCGVDQHCVRYFSL